MSKGSREYGRVEQLDRVFVGYKGICKDTNVLVNPEELYSTTGVLGRVEEARLMRDLDCAS